MMIKVNNVGRVTGIPTARVAVSSGHTDLGAEQVNVVISADDSWGCPSVISSLRLSPQEAREIAERLIAAAGGAS